MGRWITEDDVAASFCDLQWIATISFVVNHTDRINTIFLVDHFDSRLETANIFLETMQRLDTLLSSLLCKKRRVV